MKPKDVLFKTLKKNDFVTFEEATDMGVSKLMLSRLVAEGVLYRPSRKIYTTSLEWLTDPIKKYAPACTLYPDAVICGISALIFHELTDEEERKVWLAFPRDHRVVNNEFRILYPSGLAYSLGREKHRQAGREVRIYNLEKSVVDAFKYLPIDVAHKALRGYLKRRDRNLDKLVRYGRQLRKPLDETIAIMLADQ